MSDDDDKGFKFTSVQYEGRPRPSLSNIKFPAEILAFSRVLSPPEERRETGQELSSRAPVNTLGLAVSVGPVVETKINESGEVWSASKI